MDEAQHARLCALAQQLNHYLLQDHHEDIGAGVRVTGTNWVHDAQSRKPLPRLESIVRFMNEYEVVEKDADSLTSEWRKLGIDPKIGTQLDKILAYWGPWRRALF